VPAVRQPIHLPHRPNLWSHFYLPAGERRKGLEYARASHMIAEKQVIPLEQGLTVICDVLKAHHKVDDRGLMKLVCKARPHRQRSRTTRFGSC
jgi:hypothetical protein